MQINQPFALALGLFVIAVGVFMFRVGLSRMRDPLPQIKGWWLVAEGMMLCLSGLAQISSAFDLSGHISRRTGIMDVAAALVGLLVFAFIFPGARAIWQENRRRRDNPVP